MIKYSATEHACYDMSLNYSDLPDDLIEITDDEHKMFMGETIEDGYQLVKNTYPFEVEEIPETTYTDEEILELRAIAYSDSVNGSDRLFVEYQALLAQDLTDEAEEAKTAWLARRTEIKELYPLSTDE